MLSCVPLSPPSPRSPNQRLRARILFVDPASKRVGLTLQRHLLAHTLPPNFPMLGQVGGGGSGALSGQGQQGVDRRGTARRAFTHCIPGVLHPSCACLHLPAKIS
jgi:hypothetical protein